MWWLLAVAPASAHVGESVHLEPGQVIPGGAVRVDGSGFPPEAELRIVLAVDGGRTDLAATMSDGEGAVSVVVTIPPTTPAGTYAIRVETVDDAAEAVLVVAGSPDLGGGVRPGQDEPIGTLPALGGAGQAASTYAPQASVRTDRATGRVSSSTLGLLVLFAAVALMSVGMIGLGRWRRRGGGGIRA